MAYNRDLKIAPNTEVKVEFLFDTPKTFEDRFNEGRTRYAYSLKVLDDQGGTYGNGEEVTYFTSYEPVANQLNSFGRGDKAKIRSIQNPDDKYPTLEILPADPFTEEKPVWEREQGKETGPKRSPVSSTGLYPDQNPELMEMMERCMVAAAMVRENMIEAGVDPELVGEYFLTKTGLTIWMQVK